MIGAFIGGVASAEYTNDYLTGKVNEHISATNKKYGISDDISAKIRKNTSVGKYEIVAEQVSNLRELGLYDEAIMSILSNIPNGKLPSVIDAVKGWNSKNPGEKLTNSQVDEISKGVQNGKSVADVVEGVGKAIDLSKSTNPEDFLNTALKRQGLDSAPSKLKEKWSEGGYDYEVRIHEANPEYGKEGSIYRVARRSQSVDANGQGSGWEYMDENGVWHHTSTLKPSSPTYNEDAARETHIQLP